MQIGRLDLAFLIDCEETGLRERLIARGQDGGRTDGTTDAIDARISSFKEHALPAIKVIDDMDKLVVVSNFKNFHQMANKSATVIYEY